MMTPEKEIEVQDKLDQILEVAKAAKRAVNIRTTAFVTILIIMAMFQWQQFHQGRDIKNIATTVQNATGPEAAKRSQEGIAKIKQELGEENDCRSRRQQVRLPAPPDPALSCASQTDKSVYPGVVGQPSK